MRAVLRAEVVVAVDAPGVIGEVVDQVVRSVREKETRRDQRPDREVEPAVADRQQSGDPDRDEGDDEDRAARRDEPARDEIQLPPFRWCDPRNDLQRAYPHRDVQRLETTPRRGICSVDRA